MSDRCLKPEELGDLVGLGSSLGTSTGSALGSAPGSALGSAPGAEDPRWAHVDDCPRCQALLQSYAAFMDPVDVPAGADLEDADSRLAAVLDREIGPVGSGGEVIRPASTFWNPFRVRTFAAAAAVVIVAVGLSLFRPGSEVISPQEPVLRGIGAATVAPFRCQVAMLDKGGFRVTWSGIAEATGYRVVVYGEDLEELGGFDAGLETTLELQPFEGAAFCRVIALRDGDELGRSDPAYFEGN